MLVGTVNESVLELIVPVLRPVDLIDKRLEGDRRVDAVLLDGEHAVLIAVEGNRYLILPVGERDRLNVIKGVVEQNQIIDGVTDNLILAVERRIHKHVLAVASDKFIFLRLVGMSAVEFRRAAVGSVKFICLIVAYDPRFEILIVNRTQVDLLDTRRKGVLAVTLV